MARLRLTLAYDGTAFAGWQFQPARQGRTVQACLEEALARICGQPLRVHGAGRTDSGVHALAQTAHVDVPDARAGISWRKALNALLPRDVRVTAAELVAPDFHARFDAVGKVYAYTLWIERGYVLPWRAGYVWDVGRYAPLDVEAMDVCASYFAGYHDFAAFQNVGSDVKTSTRLVHGVIRQASDGGPEMVWHFRAEGFLKQMVRNLMGALVEVGRGKTSPEAIREILAGGNRHLAPATAPAHGLCLKAVEYDPLGRRPKRHLAAPSGPDEVDI